MAQLGARGDNLKRMLQEKLIAHREYIDKYGEDMPEIRDWKWNNTE